MKEQKEANDYVNLCCWCKNPLLVGMSINLVNAWYHKKCLQNVAEGAEMIKPHDEVAL